LKKRYRDRIFGGLGNAAEADASEGSPELDSRVVKWTVEALSEDEELEEFFESIPGFCTPKVVIHLRAQLSPEVWKKTSSVFLRRTLSSGSVSESVALRRLAICLNAADVVGGPFQVAKILQEVSVMMDWDKVPHAVEIGHFLRQWDIDKREIFIPERQSIIAQVVSSVLRRDDRWKALTIGHLGVSERVLEDYLAHGDSILLANLIHSLNMIRQPTRPGWAPITGLLPLSEFDIQNTLPELQRDFCVLWNKFIAKAQNSGTYSTSVKILWCIRHAYIDLHRDTDAAPNAFSDSTPDRAEVLFSGVGLTLLHNSLPLPFHISQRHCRLLCQPWLPQPPNPRPKFDIMSSGQNSTSTPSPLANLKHVEPTLLWKYTMPSRARTLPTPASASPRPPHGSGTRLPTPQAARPH
jgi:hypothetical protein